MSRTRWRWLRGFPQPAPCVPRHQGHAVEKDSEKGQPSSRKLTLKNQCAQNRIGNFTNCKQEKAFPASRPLHENGPGSAILPAEGYAPVKDCRDVRIVRKIDIAPPLCNLIQPLLRTGSKVFLLVVRALHLHDKGSPLINDPDVEKALANLPAGQCVRVPEQEKARQLPSLCKVFL